MVGYLNLLVFQRYQALDMTTDKEAKRIKLREAGARARELFLDRSGMTMETEEVVGGKRKRVVSQEVSTSDIPMSIKKKRVYV